MIRRLYLAGPMTGYPDLNGHSFFAAASRLRDAGYEVLNPAETSEQASWDDYMRCGLRQVLDVQGVALLEGWEASAGARLEVHVAQQLRLHCLPFGVWLLQADTLLRGRS